MASVLVSSRCHHRYSEPLDQGIYADDFSFSGSISRLKFPKSRNGSLHSMKELQITVEVRQESGRYGKTGNVNGRSTKMVPTKDLVKNGDSSGQLPSPGNGKSVVNGSVSVVDNRKTTALVKRQKYRTPKIITFDEELQVLPSDEGFSWAKESYDFLQRSVDIWSFVLSFRMRLFFDSAKWLYIGGFTEEKMKLRRRKTASWLRNQFLQLGPTFIKLGQMSSTRSDLFPKEFVDELAKLQDKVPAFSGAKARAFVESELGSPVGQLFRLFEDRPVAAASLGQVHRAILHSGEKVVVKIQRPGLKKLFEIDLKNLKLVAEYFQGSEDFGGPARDWIGVYDECYRILFQEIDYVNEGKNADRFRRDFRNIKWVRVPLIYWDYTTEKVLTMEYVPGTKINNVAQIDTRGYSRSLIASRAIEAYLIQILRTGFFHADPHPGNLAIDLDGSLIYYDFGMMGEIKNFTRERLLELFYSIYEKDETKVMKNLIELGVLQPTGDLSPVRRLIKFHLSNLLNQTPDQQQTLAAIGEDLFAIAIDQPFYLPANFTFFLKAFSTLEGIGHSLDPNFSFMKVAAPYAQELLDIRQRQQIGGSELVEDLRKQANEASRDTISMPYRIQRIEDFVKQLDSGDLKLRVRVLESERAARKASILQTATIHTVLCGTFLNVGVALSSQGDEAIANGSFIVSGVFLVLVLQSMKRVNLLEKFEKMI